MDDHRWFDEVSCQAVNDPLAGPLLLISGYTVPGGDKGAREILRLAGENRRLRERVANHDLRDDLLEALLRVIKAERQDGEGAVDAVARIIKENRRLRALADAAAVYEGTREPEDWAELQRLVHDYNNSHTESEG